MANVIFKFGTRAQYDALLTKDTNTLYWLYDVLELRKGEDLYGVGRAATDELAGLLTPEYKAKLDELIAAGTVRMTALDASVVIEDDKIGVKLSAKEGNSIKLLDDGLFVPVPAVPAIPKYAMEKQDVASDGFGVTYRLKEIVGEEVSYVGAEINIPKDLMLQSGSLETVVVADQPYVGAIVGDPYIDLVLNDDSGTHIYVPVKGLVDTYVAGQGVEIVDGTVSVKLSAVDANGLFVDENGVGLNLATAKSAGAMSAADKAFVDSVPSVFIARKYEISHKPAGTLVDYRDKEIRVMCPSDTQWALQNVGANGNANTYYMGFKAYAPEGAVSFKEDLGETIEDDTMYYFEGNDFAGIDAFGRKYSICWLGLAVYDAESDAWSYYGDASSESKYIGWFYTVNWYDADGVVIGSDTIRINLSNEACHNSVEPYYVASVVNDIDALKESVASMEDSFTWGAM